MTAYGWFTGSFDRVSGIVLLCLFVLYAWLNMARAKSEEEVTVESEESLEELKKISLPRNLMMLAFCAVLLFLGANLLVDNGIIIAGYLGVPERVIAVTAIALGTSLPELVTTIMSLVKGCENVGLGNIIGANILNLLLVIGIPATITGMKLETQTVRVDAPLGALLMGILILPILFRKKGSRVQGAVLLGCYVLYCAFNFF